MPSNLEEILNIPGNQEVFDCLIGRLESRDVVAFVGAGASVGLYPTWSQFIDLLANYALVEGKANAKDVARWKADFTSSPQEKVRNILRKLDEDRYRTFLKNTFGPKYGADGNPYTPVAASLMKLPFRAYVTTNYDPSLELARNAIRPNCLDTSTPTWEEDDVRDWLTGDVYQSESSCPILWIHGYWQRPNGIVLNRTEYARAYDRSLYRKTFNRIWGQDRLVFVGFGFGDPQFAFMVEEILRDTEAIHAQPRHIAILEIAYAESGRYDIDDLIERRRNLEENYHSQAIFYPVANSDHSALLILLQGLVERSLKVSSAPLVVADNAEVLTQSHRPLLSIKWVHETTNDKRFTGRQSEIDQLNRWTRDHSVRVLAACAVGGTGKTALVGHWLKETEGWQTRQFEGLFAWSFYQDRETANFFRAFLLWAQENYGSSTPDDSGDLCLAVLETLNEHSLVLVLDGLELLQDSNDARHGAFLDGELRILLTSHCRSESMSLIVLTSRFSFADLEPYMGISFHQLELRGLLQDQGGKLLRDLKVRGSQEERENISACFDGHPLGLRVFAEAIPKLQRFHPQRFLDEAFRVTNISSDAPLAGRISSILAFYQKRLPTLQLYLLGVIAIFRTPVPVDLVIRILREINPEGVLRSYSNAALSAEIAKLQDRGILTREPIEGGSGSACHPILRDHFRRMLIDSQDKSAKRAADLLKGRPSGVHPRSLKEIEMVLISIELLLESGEVLAADELYRTRLFKGWCFLWIPTIREGLNCTLGFVGEPKRRMNTRQALSDQQLGLYLNNVGIFASNSGRFDLAREYLHDRIELARQSADRANLGSGLRNYTELLIYQGRLADTEHFTEVDFERFDTALSRAEKATMYAYRGWARSVSGRVGEAGEDFCLANKISLFGGPSDMGLTGFHDVAWCELLLRTGHQDVARDRLVKNIIFCREKGWFADVARCHWLLSECALADKQLDEAELQYHRAFPILMEGQALFWLGRLYITAGKIALQNTPGELHRIATGGKLRRKGNAKKSRLPSASDSAKAALDLASSRGMRLVHIDALVLRGRTRLEKPAVRDALQAVDDGREAFRLSRECGYQWGKADALRLQISASYELIRLDPRDSSRFLADISSLQALLSPLQGDLEFSLSDLSAAQFKAADGVF